MKGDSVFFFFTGERQKLTMIVLITNFFILRMSVINYK